MVVSGMESGEEKGWMQMAAKLTRTILAVQML